MPTRRPKLPPTDAELRILQVLWRLGPSTVAAVHEVLAAEQPVAYTTTLKLLQIMREKRLVTRDESERSHVYAAAVGEAETRQAAASDLIGRVFGGSAAALVQHALAAEPASREELRRIRQMLERLERGGDTGDV